MSMIDIIKIIMIFMIHKIVIAFFIIHPPIVTHELKLLKLPNERVDFYTFIKCSQINFKAFRLPQAYSSIISITFMQIKPNLRIDLKIPNRSRNKVHPKPCGKQTK